MTANTPAVRTTDAPAAVAGHAIDYNAILRTLRLDPARPDTQALLVIADKYGLDPILRHVVLIEGRPYVTRDGLLHVAHKSGRFDGIEVVDGPELRGEHWFARVAVYRKDMARAIVYPGRYPKAGNNRKFAPEMAIKVAEVQALRRAFDVALPTVEEQWDMPADSGDVYPGDDPHRRSGHSDLMDRVEVRAEELMARDTITVDQYDKALSLARQGEDEARRALDRLDELDQPTDAEAEAVTFGPGDHAQFREWKIDDTTRRALVSLATGGRANSSKATFTQGEYRTLKALGEAFGRGAILVDTAGERPQLVTVDGVVITPEQVADGATSDDQTTLEGI